MTFREVFHHCSAIETGHVKALRHLPVYPVIYPTYIHSFFGFTTRNAGKLHVDVYPHNSGITLKIMNNSVIEDEILRIRSMSPMQFNFKEPSIGM